jgi:hypothetical protein
VETGEVWQFMFNPPTLRDQKGLALPDQPVPGMSHPVTQYAGGGARMVSFELYLDGDRGRVGQGQGSLQNRAQASSDASLPGSKSIENEIKFWQSLRYPSRTEGLGLPDIRPPRVLFTFGTLFTGMLCQVDRCEVNVTYWTVNLEPMKATLDVALKEVVSRSVPRSAIYQGGQR